ncbi:MAG: hypothetical protein IJ488_01570 [Clostridia bacterium]|nr:hypothetical protein [Clostridia bacterium]
MSRKARHEMQSDSSDYRKGYSDGMKAAFEESELDAYYAGVGYGKKASGDKHIGFNNDEERQQFEAGMRNKGKHFRAYRAEPPTFLERLFGGKSVRRENAVAEYRSKKTKNIHKRVSRKRKRAERKARHKKG